MIGRHLWTDIGYATVRKKTARSLKGWQQNNQYHRAQTGSRHNTPIIVRPIIMADDDAAVRRVDALMTVTVENLRAVVLILESKISRQRMNTVEWATGVDSGLFCF